MFTATLNPKYPFIVALVAALCVMASAAHAANPLPPAPSQGYCYQTVTTGPTYNGVTACSEAPPPPPPGTYTFGSVRYDGPSGRVYGESLTDLGVIFGRAPNAQPSAPTFPNWPYASGSQPTFIAAPRNAVIVASFVPTATPVTIRTAYGNDQGPVSISVSGAPVAGTCSGVLNKNAQGDFTITAATNNATKCITTPGLRYVLTLKAADCGRSVCAFSLIESH